MNLTISDVKVWDRFKLLYPLELGDGIEFSEGAIFEVISISQHPDEPETWHCIRLHCEEEGHHWKGLPVAIPPRQPEYLHYLNIRFETLNKSFEKIEDDVIN